MTDGTNGGLKIAPYGATDQPNENRISEAVRLLRAANEADGAQAVTLMRRAAEDVEAAIRAGAEKQGMDPDLAVQIYRREGGAAGTVTVVSPPLRKVLPPNLGGGEGRFMTHCDGYVMARKPGRAPFVMTVKEWNNLPDPAPTSPVK